MKAQTQKFTVRVRRGLDKIVEHHEMTIVEQANDRLPADDVRDIRAALQWMRENGERSKP